MMSPKRLNMQHQYVIKFKMPAGIQRSAGKHLGAGAVLHRIRRRPPHRGELRVDDPRPRRSAPQSHEEGLVRKVSDPFYFALLSGSK